MSETLILISDIVIGIGIFFVLVGLIAIFRFKNFYPRVLAASKIDTVGTITILIGIIIRHGFTWFSAKALLIMFIIILINPLSAHILTRYAYISGHGIENKDSVKKSTSSTTSKGEKS